MLKRVTKRSKTTKNNKIVAQPFLKLPKIVKTTGQNEENKNNE